MIELNSRELLLIGVCAALAAGLIFLLLAVICGLVIERIYIGRRLEGALLKLGLVQADLFLALGNAYRSVEHSHTMVMRVMRVVDRSLGIEVENNDENPDDGWAKVIGGEED